MRPAIWNTVSDSKSSCPELSFYGINDQMGHTLVRYSQNLQDTEYMLVNLSSCKVCLTGKCWVLHVNKLRHCLLCAGPVTDSVYIHDVKGSAFVLASPLIRIHPTKNVDFYLRIRSRLIIEFASLVWFAPFKTAHFKSVCSTSHIPTSKVRNLAKVQHN